MYPTASNLFASTTHGEGLDQAYFQTRRSCAVFQSMRHLSKTLGAGAAAVPRADCGMSEDATRALEQSRRSAPVNNHVCCRLQSTQKGSTLESVHSELWCGKTLLVRGVFRLRAMSPYYPMWDILGRVATGRLDISTLSCPSPVPDPSFSSLVLSENTPPPLLLEGK